jgi:hypothetical protein
MDPVTAIGLLLANLTKLAEFGAVIAKARAEGRDLTPAEVLAAGAFAQSAIDRLDSKLGS